MHLLFETNKHKNQFFLIGIARLTITWKRFSLQILYTDLHHNTKHKSG